MDAGVPAVEEDLGFWFDNTWNEFPYENLITKETAWEVALHFWRTGGERSAAVDWEEL